MSEKQTKTEAHPNIAFIKYWGNAVPSLRLPANGSISMNLEGLKTITSISEIGGGDSHILQINGEHQTGPALQRLDIFIRQAAEFYDFRPVFLSIESTNNFPIGAGIASSASAFASLALAIDYHFKLSLSQEKISALARLGSGSACRSVPSGFSEWKRGTTHWDSFAFSIAPASHWELYDLILIVDQQEKKVGSTKGHEIADTSPFQSVRVHDANRRIEICRAAILAKDFEKLADIIEQDSDMMHAVMMTSKPPLTYWQPASLAIMQAVREMRKKGIACAYTMDAGPNVHVICTPAHLKTVQQAFMDFPGIQQALTAKTGGEAKVVASR
jgi:diphosphomevalonate decarboxylase